MCPRCWDWLQHLTDTGEDSEWKDPIMKLFIIEFPLPWNYLKPLKAVKSRAALIVENAWTQVAGKNVLSKRVL